MLTVEEYSRDTAAPPEWVEIACGWTIIKFVCHGTGIRASTRFSIAESRRRKSTFVPEREFEEARRLAQNILNPYRPSIHARPHWTDDQDD